MKSFTRTCLIFSGVILAIGLVLVIIGASLGAGSAFANMVRNGGFSWSWDSEHTFIDGKDLKNVDQDFTNINKLDIDLRYGSFTIEKSDNNSIKVVGEDLIKDFECKEEAGTLVITDHLNKNGKFRFADNYNPTITLYIPENYSFSEMDIDMGAGYVGVNNVNADDINIDMGAGEFEGSSISSKESSLSVGAGHIYADKFVTGSVELDCGTGEMEISGTINGNADIECGVGSLIVSTTNKESEYNYDVNCGIGGISIGDSTFGGVASEKYIDNKAEHTMKIDCGIGNIEINFDESL